jgi:hypothetical protein
VTPVSAIHGIDWQRERIMSSGSTTSSRASIFSLSTFAQQPFRAPNVSTKPDQNIACIAIKFVEVKETSVILRQEQKEKAAKIEWMLVAMYLLQNC